MGSKIGSFGRLYASRNKTVFVSSDKDCPRISVTAFSIKFRDDFSKGFRTAKVLAKAVLS